MDDLPLELKQRVCGYLTTKDLKSLRSISKGYAAATDRYLLPRIFLFNNPDSFQNVQDIVEHPELRYSVTTLVINTSRLLLFPKYEDWGRRFAEGDQKPDNKIVARAERASRRKRNW